MKSGSNISICPQKGGAVTQRETAASSGYAVILAPVMRFAPCYARTQGIFPAELKSKIQVLFPRRGGSKVSLASPEHGAQFGDVKDSGCSCSSDDSMRDAPESKVTCI